MVNSFLNSYFGFNRQQRNGLMVLICISLLLFVIRIAYPYFMTPGDIEVKNLPLLNDSAMSKPVNQQKKSAKFKFDPNSVSRSQLVELGLSEKTAVTFIKFRERHPFSKKEDLKKVFGVSEALYAELVPYVVFETNNSESKLKSSVSKISPQQKSKVELNSADSTKLETLKGIGPAFARRIVKYRDMLGGFVNKRQLLEVYGFTEEKYGLVENDVEVDPSLVHKINVNTDDFKIVNHHPYISYELTKKIFDARKKSPLTESSLKDLLADNALLSKLLPYLNF